jgi:hypothetical protein
LLLVHLLLLLLLVVVVLLVLVLLLLLLPVLHLLLVHLLLVHLLLQLRREQPNGRQLLLLLLPQTFHRLKAPPKKSIEEILGKNES